MSLEHVVCNLCGADDTVILFDRTGREGVSGKLEAGITTDVYSDYGRIVKCRRCSLVYRDPRPLSNAVDSAYADLQDPDYLEEEDCRHINAHLALRSIRRHVTSGRLLEVGCAAGYFLNAARYNFDVVGVEPSRWASQIAEKRVGAPVKNLKLAEANFPSGSFDALVMLDVIEHFVDPRFEIETAARTLKPGGLLYIVTPDIESLSARILRGYWWGLRSGHLFYFSKKTISQLLQQQGLTVLEIRSYGRIFTYGYWLSRIKNYPRPLVALVRMLIRAFGVENKVVYLDTRDSMEICAVKR